jgi:predicted amidohydrolase
MHTPESAAICYPKDSLGSYPQADESKSKPTLLNIASFISSTGTILSSYTKKNLWHPERSVMTPGGRDPPHTVLQTPLGPVGLLVCWDLAFPEAFRTLVRQGAKIIIIPTFWFSNDLSADGLKYNSDSESLFLTSTLTARAFESTAAIIFCNAAGPSSDGYLGLSRVTLPIVGPVAGSFNDSSVGMRLVEVDMEILEVAERNYKVREDLGREDWHYGYSHES